MRYLQLDDAFTGGFGKSFKQQKTQAQLLISKKGDRH